MKTVIINGKEYRRVDGEPLKEVLEEYGFEFPCGGNGQCGRCKINCAEMEPTEKDKRFLSEKAISEGFRLACDKVVDSDYDITCPPPTQQAKRRELSVCNIAVCIGVKEIEIAIADESVAETVKVDNPLYKGDGIEGIVERYLVDPKSSGKQLKAVLSKESIEFFEKYGKAKAETFAIASNGLFNKILLGVDPDEEVDYNKAVGEDNLGLPTESVYFLPCVGNYVGGELLCETVNYPQNTMLIDCEEIFTVVSIGKDNNTVASMWDLSYDETGLKAVRAAIRTVREEGVTPFVRVYGEYAETIEKILLNEELNFTFSEKKIENVAKVFAGLRQRAKLEKEKTITSVYNILGSETFHQNFALND